MVLTSQQRICIIRAKIASTIRGGENLLKFMRASLNISSVKSSPQSSSFGFWGCRERYSNRDDAAAMWCWLVVLQATVVVIAQFDIAVSEFLFYNKPFLDRLTTRILPTTPAVHDGTTEPDSIFGKSCSICISASECSLPPYTLTYSERTNPTTSPFKWNSESLSKTQCSVKADTDSSILDGTVHNREVELRSVVGFIASSGCKC